ncbi:hypothetical protein ACO9S2_14980 [Nitrospira sp. NS4]|uniref:hypothetical protein n=1 Tax=Nitrospira sp. NS4 TaxID=3414498 RepID=UPI003C2B8F01
MIATGIITAPVIATTIALLITSFGCTPTVRPLNPDNLQIEKAEDALVFGRIHLMLNGKDQHTGLRYPTDVEWWISEETRGMRFFIDDLPIEGPYILRLPIGRYRITALSFDDALGKWHSNLAAAFTVRPGCTYLGTWELQMQTGMFSGEVSGQVSDQLASARGDVGQLSCSITVMLLESAPQGRVRLVIPLAD